MNINEQKKTCVVFAAGQYMRANIRYIETLYTVAAFSDNDPAKWGTEPLGDGRKCVPPSGLPELRADAVIIAVERPQTAEEIRRQLEELGIQPIAAEEILEQCVRKWDQIQLENFGDKKIKTWPNRITRYIACYMDKQACNLRCSYCYVSQYAQTAGKVVPLKHSPAFIARALSAERLGGKCMISICVDGEPLISDDMVELIELLLKEGHYVYVVTNGTIGKALERLGELPQELLTNLLLRFSFHYFELRRLHLMEQYFENIRKFYAAGGSISVALVGAEEYISEIEEIKKLCISHLGALPQVDFVRDDAKRRGENTALQLLTNMDRKAYIQTWESFDSEYARCRERFSGVPGGICDAGRIVFHLDLMSGNLYRCPKGRKVDNIYDNLANDIAFLKSAEECPVLYCDCAPTYYAFGLRTDHTDVPTFYELLNRKTQDGKNWIHEEAKEFLSSKLEHK